MDQTLEQNVFSRSNISTDSTLSAQSSCQKMGRLGVQPKCPRMVGTLEEEEIGDTVLPKAALVREGSMALVGMEGRKARAKQ